MVEAYKRDVATNPKVELIHLSLDLDEQKALSWARKERFPWPTLLKNDTGKELLSHHRGGVPAYVLVDRSGNLLASGKREIWDRLRKMAPGKEGA